MGEAPAQGGRGRVRGGPGPDEAAQPVQEFSPETHFPVARASPSGGFCHPRSQASYLIYVSTVPRVQTVPAAAGGP